MMNVNALPSFGPYAPLPLDEEFNLADAALRDAMNHSSHPASPTAAKTLVALGVLVEAVGKFSGSGDRALRAFEKAWKEYQYHQPAGELEKAIWWVAFRLRSACRLCMTAAVCRATETNKTKAREAAQALVQTIKSI